jgi:dephospho-CoA kinase
MASSNWRVILSGGIGSGKSAVAEMLAERGTTCISADAVGHEVLDGPARAAVAARWPQTVTANGIDRAALAALVFQDPSLLQELEAMTHPFIRERILDLAKAASGPVVVEIPVIADMLGTGWIRVVVDAPDRIRVTRLLNRGMEPGEVARRIAAQPMRGHWLAVADIVLDNSENRAHLAAEVDRLWRRLEGP